MDREIRMKGMGTVHFTDEHKRPRELKGTIIVDYRSLFQPIFVKIEAELLRRPSDPQQTKQYLMPFTSVSYIEWDLIEQ